MDTARKKLTSQRFPDSGFLVLYGAGGGIPTAAYLPLGTDTRRLLIDQTLYWCHVASEDEAVFIAGLFNSPALNEAIKPFQPRGAFDERHIHELPAKVTPGYNAQAPAHVEVVAATRALMTELKVALARARNARATDPMVDLKTRRGHVRNDVMPSLESYVRYRDACKTLYAL